jgi:NifU-like protein
VSLEDTDPDKMLCYCLGVRYGEVIDTVRDHDCRTVAQVTRLCRAGGGCRSCHPEIEGVIREVRESHRARRGLWARITRMLGLSPSRAS